MVDHREVPVVGLPPAVDGPAFLRDGTEVWVRPPQPSDDDLLREFSAHEELEALDLHYFPSIRPPASGGPDAPAPSPEDRLCLLVLGEHAGRVRLLAVGEYQRSPTVTDLAELAFLVAEPFRGRGIGSLLLARLARAARGFGLVCFDARIRAANPEILEVFGESGRSHREELEEGEVHVLIPLSPEFRPRTSALAVPEGGNVLDRTASGEAPQPAGGPPGRRRPLVASSA